MRQAAEFILGEHDFKSFCSAKTQVTDTVRTVYDLKLERDQEDVITIRITGSGFFTIWCGSSQARCCGPEPG